MTPGPAPIINTFLQVLTGQDGPVSVFGTVVGNIKLFGIDEIHGDFLQRWKRNCTVPGLVLVLTWFCFIQPELVRSSALFGDINQTLRLVCVRLHGGTFLKFYGFNFSCKIMFHIKDFFCPDMILFSL